MTQLMKKALLEGLPALNLQISEETADQLCAFGAAVVEQNAVMNLTAITEPEAVAKLHLLDSLTVLTVENLTGKTVIDVGCGAGFPGVPLANGCTGWKPSFLSWVSAPAASPPGQKKLWRSIGKNSTLPPVVLWRGSIFCWN